MSTPEIRLVEAELITGSAAIVVQVLKRDAEYLARRFEELAVDNYELRKKLEGGK